MVGLSVMIVGSGAREHAISNAYEKSSLVEKIIVAPGNDFIKINRQKEVILEKSAFLQNANSILQAARKHRPDLVEVCQDDAIAVGAVDLLKEHGFQTFGPTKKAARLEWDKKWSREFMLKHNIPCPKFRYFDNQALAGEYAEEIYRLNPHSLIYTKATGLCSGKGALKTTNLAEAYENIYLMKQFREAGSVFLIEEGLVGEEFSSYAISDGCEYKIFNSAQDHKTLLAGDEGPQTGGMGAISPAMVTKDISQKIETELIAKAISGMHEEGIPYEGILYVGGMLTQDGLKNIEYNARWGDPECQAVLPAIKNDYAQLVLSTLEKKLSHVSIETDDLVRVCVVGVSKGYPENHSKSYGARICGLEDVMKLPDVTVLGTGVEICNGKFYAKGGRLFSIVASGTDIIEARAKAYEAMSRISIDRNKLHYRTDIGWRDVERIRRE